MRAITEQSVFRKAKDITKHQKL